MTGRIAGPLWERFLLHAGQPAPPTDGILSEPMAEGTGVDGGLRARMEAQERARR